MGRIKLVNDVRDNSVESILRLLVSSRTESRDKGRRILVDRSSRICVGDIIDYLREGNVEFRRGAIVAISEIRLSKKDKATVLRMASNDADVWVRYHFCYAIPHLCSRVTPRIRGILARFLNDASWHVRYAALEVMENLSITDHRFCEAAVRALKDSQWNVRCAAARAVTLCMCSYSPAIEALGNATKDSNCCVRASVTEAMGSAGRQSGLNAIVELLTRMISDPDVEVQIKAFSAAAQFLKELASITSALRRVLKGKEEKGPRKGVGSL